MQFVGIDVSAKTLVVHVQPPQGACQQLVFDNTWEGHQKLCRRLTKYGRPTRVALEATGLYSLDVALALVQQSKVEVMVVNPRSLRDFARAELRRSKTDAVDAEALLEYVQRMRFHPWQPPTPESLELRAIGRRLADLSDLITQEKNRLHATSFVACLAPAVQRDLQTHLQHLKDQLKALEREACQLLGRHPHLQEDFHFLLSTPGIATKSAIQILGELGVLPEDMGPRQWVAHAGLDPRSHDSGSSVHKPAQMSRCGNRHLRRFLYMPALVAVRRDPHVKAFYDELLARGKKPLQALVAVMRKLLHSLNGMLRHRSPFEGQKFRVLKTSLAA
jgi:transposase